MATRTFRRFAHKVKTRKEAAALLGSIIVVGATGLASIKRIPLGHCGVIRKMDGTMRPQVVLINPFTETFTSLRLTPMQKRLIRFFRTKDGKEVEPRLVWAPDIFQRYGRDYGRSFVDTEAVVDIEDVVKKHTLKALTGDRMSLEEALGSPSLPECYREVPVGRGGSEGSSDSSNSSSTSEATLSNPSSEQKGKEEKIQRREIPRHLSISPIHSPETRAELYQREVVEDIKWRIHDACFFQHLKLSTEDFRLEFLVPEY